MGYDRVLVGTDGSPSSMLAVERAGQVASASEAELVVVTAYDPVAAQDAAILNLAVGNLREHQIRGQGVKPRISSARATIRCPRTVPPTSTSSTPRRWR